MQIHIARNGQKLGPYSLEEVNRQLAAGTLTTADLGWYEGAAGWMPLTSVPGVGVGSVSGGETGGGAFVPTPPVYATSSTNAFAQSTAYGGFWIRLLAYLIDGVILAIPGFIVGVVLGGVMRIGGTDNGSASAASGLGGLINLVLGFLYFTLLWSSAMQASLGQKVCGLKVITTAGGQLSYLNAVGRYFALLLSFMILFIGVIMVAFTERKQGLHDMLAGTYVI